MTDPRELAIVAHDVGVRYDLRVSSRRTLRDAFATALGRSSPDDEQTHFWALRHVSFVVKRGDIVGLIGRNGSGKSTLMLAIAEMLRPDAGSILTLGRTSTLLTLGAGFEPNLTGRENIYLNAALLGLPRKWIEPRINTIIDFSELDQFIDVPLRKYSAGMRARLGFSVAVHTDPEVLLIDEVLGVGDEAFRRKSEAKLRELMERAKAIVVVSHSMSFINQMCNRVIWLSDGHVAAAGDPSSVIEQYVDATRDATGPVRTIA